MAALQLKLDFNGKKTERITIPTDESLKAELESLVKDLGRENIADLCREYVIECVFRDRAKIELMKARGVKLFVNMG
jgi:hypothetical protein